MKKVQFYFALWAAKGAQLIMRLLGRNATYLPGKVAIKLCKDFLRYLTPPKTVIAVTGTNGKTTVSNLVTSILQDNGYRVTNNSLGSNVQAGVIAALIADSNLLGKPKKDIAVLEVDERSSLLIYPYLHPDYLLCNNLMRDSLKRNAHTDFIRYIIDKAIPSTTKLILNGDDLIASSLGSLGQSRVHFGIEAEKPAHSAPQYVRDIVYCPQCGQALESEYIRYNHIGRHTCPACGFGSPVPDFAVTAIDRENSTFTVTCDGKEHVYPLINDNIVNIYNFCGIIALLSQLGLSQEQIAASLAKSKIVKTRYDEAKVGDVTITMLMSKGQNPIACSRSLDYVAKAPVDNKGVIIIVDDHDDNIGNSESVAWYYDSDYTPLADPSIGQIVFGGIRSKDQYLRALLAGVSPEKIRLCESSSGAAALLDTDRCKNVYVLFDLTRPAEAKANKQTIIQRVETEAQNHGN